MSPRDRHLVALSWGLLLGGPFAQAQTIADYSRAQRALLESTMSQAAARSIGFAASAPNVAAPASTPAPTASPQRSTPPSLPAPGPGVQVSGVFASNAVSVAEVVVDATAYLLQAGQGVPGTPWRVEAVAVDRVVLSRRGAASFADGDGAVKVFALPALR